MNWLFFTVVGMVIGSLSNILRRVIMKDDKSDALASVIVFQFLGFGIMLIFSFMNGFSLPDIAIHPLNYLLQALLWGTASYSLFKASKLLEAGEVSIIATLTSIVTIVSAIIWLHETFTLTQMAGTILIISAVVMVSFQTGKIKLNRGIWYVLLYCLVAGVAVTNDTFLLKSNNIYSLLIVGWFTPGLFLLVIQPKAISKMSYFLKWSRFKRLFFMTLTYSLGGVAFYYAISIGGQASQVNTISQGGIILTTVMGALFLKEREHLGKKFLAAIMVVVGALLLS